MKSQQCPYENFCNQSASFKTFIMGNVSYVGKLKDRKAKKIFYFPRESIFF